MSAPRTPCPPAEIALVVFDVDGVLTDGGLTYGSDGATGLELKRFHIRDGLAMKLAPAHGLQVGLLTARTSAAVQRRAAELGIKHVTQGSGDKAEGIARLAAAADVTLARTAFVGDDLQDLPALRCVGWAACPADAAWEVQAACHHTSSLPGGRGVAREVIETLLKADGRWAKLVEQVAGGAPEAAV